MSNDQPTMPTTDELATAIRVLDFVRDRYESVTLAYVQERLNRIDDRLKEHDPYFAELLKILDEKVVRLEQRLDRAAKIVKELIAKEKATNGRQDSLESARE